MQAALIAIQLEISASVLASADAYRRQLDDAATRAVAAAGACDARLVVFPELAGHLALYALSGAAAHRSKTLATALAASAVRRPLEVLRGITTTRRLDGRHAVLAALAPDGERWWKSVFAPLARRLDAYLVAGSHLRLGLHGELTNTSLLFAPDGKLVATTDKVNLVPGTEDAAPGGLALARGDAGAIPIAATAFGSLATVIGYDGCAAPESPHERFVVVGRVLAERATQLAVVANPAASPRDGLGAMLAATRCARWGVTAQLVGDVLDLVFAGRSQIVDVDRVLARAPDDRRGGHVTSTISC